MNEAMESINFLNFWRNNFTLSISWFQLAGNGNKSWSWTLTILTFQFPEIFVITKHGNDEHFWNLSFIQVDFYWLVNKKVTKNQNVSRLELCSGNVLFSSYSWIPLCVVKKVSALLKNVLTVTNFIGSMTNK